MKYMLAQLVLVNALVLSACGTGDSPTPAPATLASNTADSKPSSQAAPGVSVEPVVVSALCTLMGRPQETSVSANQPVIVRWGWNATTAELVQEHVDNSETVVTLDGSPLEGTLEGGIKKDEGKGYYIATWRAEVGKLDVGTHVLTYFVTWTKQISDGTDTYGPGTKNVSFADECKLIVE